MNKTIKETHKKNKNTTINKYKIGGLRVDFLYFKRL